MTAVAAVRRRWRLMSRTRVVWDGMGFPSVRHGLMTALLAAFVSLFVLVSAVDAATCSPEAMASPASSALADIPVDQDDGGPADNHAICSHGHCHHGGVAVPQTPDAPVVTHAGADLNARLLADGLPSRVPAGPERPPRG